MPKEARGDIQTLCRLRSCLLVNQNAFELQHTIGPGITPNWLIYLQFQRLRDADQETRAYGILCQLMLQDSVYRLIQAKINPTHELVIHTTEQALAREIARIARSGKTRQQANGLRVTRFGFFAAVGAATGTYLARRCNSLGD